MNGPCEILTVNINPAMNMQDEFLFYQIINKIDSNQDRFCSRLDCSDYALSFQHSVEQTIKYLLKMACHT